MKGLVVEEVAKINHVKNNSLRWSAEKDIEDPTDKMIIVLDLFMNWYGVFRQPLMDIDQLYNAAEKTVHLQETLKLIFPKKSGQLGWL